MRAGRYHLLLTTDGRPVAHGWWNAEATARAKHTEWIGAWGKPGAAVSLMDEETGKTLTTWTAEP